MANAANPRVQFETSLGMVVLEIDAERAPKSAANFLRYVDDGFYNGTIFHRVIPGFMAQGGGFTADMQQKKTQAPITNEADNGLKNQRGTLAMARTNDPHSATAQFFINFVDSTFLDFRAPNAQGWGYAVLGRVVEGMNVVDAMAKVPTGNTRGMGDVPQTTITLLKATRLPEAQAVTP